jgi:hypothetical protein
MKLPDASGYRINRFDNVDKKPNFLSTLFNQYYYICIAAIHDTTWIKKLWCYGYL